MLAQLMLQYPVASRICQLAVSEAPNAIATTAQNDKLEDFI